MDPYLKKTRLLLHKPLFMVLLCISCNNIYGQQLPSLPNSWPVFTPYILNPAIAGSKDFFSMDLSTGWADNYNSFLAAGAARIARRMKKFRDLPVLSDYTNFGAGSYIFNERTGPYNNTGAAGIFSWHLKLSADALSFISFGLSAKALYTVYYGEPDLGRLPSYELYPDMDLGVYFYSPSFYAGLSGLNLLRDYTVSDTTGYSLPNVDRHLSFQAGYRQIINRNFNLVIEPSILVSENYSFSGNIKDMLSPMLKVYTGLFCAGIYYKNLSTTNFFFIYKYPKFDIGVFFRMPGKTPYFRNPPVAELKIGINLSSIIYNSRSYNHW